MSLKESVKSKILPAGSTQRRLRIGVPRGIVMDIDFQSQSIVYLGLYEVELSKHFKAICKPGLVCWDIGASVGYYSLLMAKLTGASVVAFEPDESAMGTFHRNMNSNPSLAATVTLVPAFVSSKPKGEGVVSIDSFVSVSGAVPPDVLKIDVEGAEFDVLEGGQDTIIRVLPSIILEVHSIELETLCLSFLTACGYNPKVVSARRWSKETRPIAHNRWLVAHRPV